MPPSAPSRLPPSDPFADRRPRLALLVSDREWTARALESVLVEDGYATLRAETADQAVAVCAAADPDVVFVEQRFVDAALGGEGERGEPGGLTLCRRLRQVGVVSDAAPVVVTTADTVRRSDVLDALAAGAWDLCALPGDASALLARCAAWVRGKRHADRARESGLTDLQTGLYNLRGLTRRARELAGAARRADQRAPLACVAFRAVGAVAVGPGRTGLAGGADAVGAGASPQVRGRAVDPVVERVRETCLAAGRASDVLARIGGREFAILAPHTSAEGAHRLVERLRDALAVGSAAGGGAAWPGGVPLADARLAPGVTLHAAIEAAESGVSADDEAVELVMRAITALHARS